MLDRRPAEVGTMSTNDEMRRYLYYLLDHESDCVRENCPICESARNIYETGRGLIFSRVAYPHVAITAQRAATATGQPLSGARKASAKRAA
jgi:hypothetical protein